MVRCQRTWHVVIADKCCRDSSIYMSWWLYIEILKVRSHVHFSTLTCYFTVLWCVALSQHCLLQLNITCRNVLIIIDTAVKDTVCCKIVTTVLSFFLAISVFDANTPLIKVLTYCSLYNIASSCSFLRVCQCVHVLKITSQLAIFYVTCKTCIISRLDVIVCVNGIRC